MLLIYFYFALVNVNERHLWNYQWHQYLAQETLQHNRARILTEFVLHWETLSLSSLLYIAQLYGKCGLWQVNQPDFGQSYTCTDHSFLKVVSYLAVITNSATSAPRWNVNRSKLSQNWNHENLYKKEKLGSNMGFLSSTSIHNSSTFH